jgi:vacuolar-type H+-ATPase subunit I/STV1
MVEVDVFWAYGFGASLGLGAGRQLRKLKKPFESRYFVWTLLFLSLIWAPTGMLLLLRNTSWETMQVAENLEAIPIFLTLGFGITNITQGILGFWVALKLVQKERYYLANLNWMFGYFGMFFILVYGWDGLGYDRFFYDRAMLPGSPAWTPGAATGGTLMGLLQAELKFLTSSVALTLFIDGVYLIPPFAVLMLIWYVGGLRDAGHKVSVVFPTRMLLSYLFGVFALSLGSAIFCAAVVNYTGQLLGVGNHIARGLGQIPANTPMHVISYLVGLPLGLGILWATVLKPGGIAHRLMEPWCIDDEAENYVRLPAPQPHQA